MRDSMEVRSPSPQGRARKGEYTAQNDCARLAHVPQDSCPERSTLSKAVAAAVTETYRAKGKYDTANERQAGNVDQLAEVLSKARAAERAAERALQEHINQHGCKI